MKTFLVPALMMSTVFSFANEASDELMNRTAFEGQLTRTAVHADFIEARRQGTLPDTSEAGAMHLPTHMRAGLPGHQLTRKQITAEYIQARADGSLVDTSDAGSMHAPAFGSRQQSRPDLYAERADTGVEGGR